MTSIHQSGTPTPSIQQAGLRVAQQQAGPAALPPTELPAQLSPQEQLLQSAGLSGSAVQVDLVGNSPYNNQIRRLLAAEDFKSLAQILLQANPADLAGLDLSLAEIEQIAQGMGQGSWFQGLPLVGSYRGDQKQMIALLIQAADLKPNQQLSALHRLVDLDAVLSYVRTASQDDLATLSHQHRHMALAVLDPGNSIWGTISGAATELVDRRVLGNSRENDQIASRILRSAPNEAELKRLMQSINSFNRDDVVYRYVLDLSARELAALSDETKLELMAALVDSEAFGVDFNTLGNLDELFKMTFPEHAEAAQRLYASMSATAQASTEVQAVANKSDELKQRIAALESALRADLASGELPREKIASYAQQLQAFQESYPDDAEIQSKVSELMQWLQQAQQRLDQAARIETQTLITLEQTESQLDTANQSLQALESELGKYLTQLDHSQQQLTQASQQIEAQYAQLVGLYSRLEGSEAQSLLSEMQALLESDRSLPQKEARLQQLNQALQQLSQELNQNGAALQGLIAEISQTNAQLTQQRQAYQAAVTGFAAERDQLQGQQHELGILLTTYQKQVGQLELELAQAQQRWQTLADNPALRAEDKALLQQELQELAQAVSRHQQQSTQLQQRYDHALLPRVEALDRVTAQVQVQAEAAATQTEEVEKQQLLWTSAVEVATSLWDKVQSQVDRFKNLLTGAESAEDLDQLANNLSQELAKLRADLLHEGLSETEIQSHLQELQAVLNQVEKTRSLLQETESIQQSMKTAQAEFEIASGNLRQTIAAAQDAAESALETIEETWQPRIRAVEQELEGLEGQMQNYAENVADLQQALERNETLKTEAKQAFAESLRTALQQGTGDITDLQQALRDKIAVLEDQRIRLQSRLTEAEKEMKTVAQSIQAQRSELETYQAGLAQESTQLAELHHTIDQQRQLLVQLQERNQAQLAQNETLLRHQQGNLPPALSQALNQLSTQQEQLAELVIQTQAILDDHSGQSALDNHAASLQNYVRNTQNKLNQSLNSLNITAGQQQAVQQHLNTLQSQLAEINGSAQRTQSSIQDFLKDLETTARTGGMTYEELFSRAEAVLAQAETLEDFELINAQLTAFLKEVDSRAAAASQVVSAMDEMMGGHESRLHAIAQEVRTIGATTRGISRAIDSLQSEVNQHQHALLSTQRSLLEQRRSLGIASQEYQQNLQQYDNLLSLGRPLTPQEQQQLHQLEKTLSGIESQLMQTSGKLQERISGLNDLKNQVNQYSNNLKSSINRLKDLSLELQTMKPEIEAARDALITEHAQQTQDRERVQALIEQLEQGPQAGTPRVQEKLRALRERLDTLDSNLARLNKGIQRQERLLNRINQTQTSIQEEIALAQNQIAQLELLFAKVEELLVEAGRQLQEVQQLLGQVQQFKTQFAEVKAQAETLLNERPQGLSSSARTSQDQKSLLPDSDDTHWQQLQKNIFSRQLSNTLTSLWAGRHQTEAQRQAAEHQNRREVFQAELEHRLALARQYDEELQVQLKQQASLEQSTAYLIQQIEYGQRANSGLNLV